MKFVVTGAGGLIGWHAATRLHAANCAATFKSEPAPFEIVLLDHSAFADNSRLRNAVKGADAVLHFAGVNRASDDEVERTNPEIAGSLIAACIQERSTPHIVYANSVHAATDTPYGRGKRLAGQLLASGPGRYTNLVLPHIFGETGRPFYNNVTATFIHQIINGEDSNPNPDGRVNLLHAGAAAQCAIDAVLESKLGELAPSPKPFGVIELLDTLKGFHASYRGGLFPDLRDPFDLALFNSYRTALYPEGFPLALKLNEDARGTLFEAAKGGGGGQTFVSWTEPGVTRGNHFHLHKVERFLVLEGEAIIRIRRVLGGKTWEYRVNGKTPTVVDMPTMHTHSIENIGTERLLTLFWTHDVFQPDRPDTYFDPVLEN